MDANEEELLRSVALQNARGILVARQRAEEDLVRSKEALEVKTSELELSLAMMRATLEAASDAMLVTNADGRITDFNEKYVQLWSLSDEIVESREHERALAAISRQFADPAAFLARVAAIYTASPAQALDVLELLDGRVFERSSKVQLVGSREVGRVWNFRDVTQNVQAAQALREETRILELLNQTGTVLASTLDVEGILQWVTDAATKITRARFGAFFYNKEDEQGKSFTLYTLSGASREAFDKFPLPRATALFGPTFRGEGILRIDDVLKDPRYGKSGPYHGMPPGHLPVRSYLAVPVTSRSGFVYGGLFFGHEVPGTFVERDERVVAGIAAQAAIAIDNARLFEASESARQELQQVNSNLEQRVTQRTVDLHKSEQQFQQLVDGVTDCAIYMLDPGGHVVSWNPGAERIKGYRAEEIIGQHFSRFYTEEDRVAGVPQQALRTAERVGKYETESWRVRKDGTRFWTNALINSIRDEHGALIGFAKVTRDMSELRAIQEQLHQSQKMEAIGQLTGGVAHDFNNLLTVILGNLETVSRHLPAEDGRLRRAVENANRGAQRATTLTQQLLAFSRRQPLNPKPTDINRLVSGSSELMRRTLGENVVIETVLGGGLWRVDVDAHQLESALLNLAVNSRDAMPEGGKLTIETANAYLDEAYANRFVEIQQGQYVVICVSDTGVGMSAEVLSKAFDPFFTTKPIGEGTGLGLSQVYGFVKQSGGHVRLYSESGQGTTVRIYLPRLLGEEVEVEHDTVAVVPQGQSSETVLVVEDDEDVRAYSTQSLRELGYTVLEATDAASALRALERHPEVELLFTDVGLPGLNGRELVDRAKRKRPRLKVLFTTGYARNAIVHQGRLDSGVELLTKPFSRAQLAARVRDVIDAGPQAAPGQRMALIVEDESLVRLFLTDVLEEIGFTVVEAASVAEALQVSQERNDFEVAFVDVGLPDGSGLDVAHQLRSRSPQLAVAVASGYGNALDARLHDDPRVTQMNKPYDEAAIREALERLSVR
ncbi:MAG TPA: response regulator [Steroidobacteraceae bacterium]|jgi:PAS domain S-box-containing protein